MHTKNPPLIHEPPAFGFSLNDYYEEELFEDIDDFPVFYLWGKTRVYVCQTKGDPVDEDLSAQIVSQLEQNSQE